MVTINGTLALTTDDPLVLEPPRGFKGISIQCVHTAGSSAVEVSNNKVNWFPIALLPVALMDTGGAIITSVVASGIWYNPNVVARYIRAVKTGNGSQVLTLVVNEDVGG